MAGTRGWVGYTHTHALQTRLVVLCSEAVARLKIVRDVGTSGLSWARTKKLQSQHFNAFKSTLFYLLNTSKGQN